MSREIHTNREKAWLAASQLDHEKWGKTITYERKGKRQVWPVTIFLITTKAS